MELQLTDTYRLSAHVCIRPLRDAFVVETPLTQQRFPLSNASVFKLLLALARPVRLCSLIGEAAPDRRDAILAFIQRCHEAGLLVRVDDNSASDEERGSMASWDFHDLLFHARSRVGRHAYPLGATFPFLGITPPSPAIRPRSFGTLVCLSRPDDEADDADGERGMSLTRALETRRSTYRTTPLDLETLSEFLYRTMRITSVSDSGPKGEVLKKLYPSGGGLHPLEPYIIAWSCAGLQRGLYHYRAGDHALETVSGPSPDLETLLSAAQRTAGPTPLSEYPPVMFILTARFRRTAWKYESIAYRVILIEVGALIQTMYLVATDMGLAPCAIGSGNSDRFARIIGTDYYEETSVGEFILGGRSESGVVA